MRPLVIFVIWFSIDLNSSAPSMHKIVNKVSCIVLRTIFGKKYLRSEYLSGRSDGTACSQHCHSLSYSTCRRQVQASTGWRRSLRSLISFSSILQDAIHQNRCWLTTIRRHNGANGPSIFGWFSDVGFWKQCFIFENPFHKIGHPKLKLPQMHARNWRSRNKIFVPFFSKIQDSSFF